MGEELDYLAAEVGRSKGFVLGGLMLPFTADVLLELDRSIVSCLWALFDSSQNTSSEIMFEFVRTNFIRCSLCRTNQRFSTCHYSHLCSSNRDQVLLNCISHIYQRSHASSDSDHIYQRFHKAKRNTEFMLSLIPITSARDSTKPKTPKKTRHY